MEAEDWKELREERKEKRWSNYESSLELLNLNNIPYKEFANGHIRVGEWDFWATTGLFIHRRTGKRGRGIQYLLKTYSQMNHQNEQRCP